MSEDVKGPEQENGGQGAAPGAPQPTRIVSPYPSRQRFEEIVADALASIPDDLWNLIDNVAVLVEEWPDQYQLESVGLRNPRSLLGLYEGVPLTRRNQGYGIVAPDRVTIFRRPIYAACGPNEQAILEQIRRTVLHEIAHHFGISDARLIELGAY